MQPLDYYKKAWVIVRADLLSWALFYTLFIGLSLLTCGLAGLLAPNVSRELRDAHREQRGPEPGALFRMDRLANDLINAVIWLGALSAGGAMGGVGSAVAAVGLQFQMPLAADDRYSPIDNSRLCLKHVGAHLGDHVVFFLIASGLGMVSVFLCLLPLPIIAPVLGMATWLWYEDSREEIDRMAAEGGIRLLEGPTVEG